MDCRKVKETIVNWLVAQLKASGQKGFVVGISGGVDSALVSTLCAETGYPVLCLSMPILQAPDQLFKARLHMEWLKSTYKHIENMEVDLTETFQIMLKSLGRTVSELSEVNTRSRLRMTTLYAMSNDLGYLVAGTGNKIEDYGIGFFTLGGDGQVDCSPIGDLKKTEVWELAKYVGVDDSIVKAKPTDGLWNDNRGDEDAIGASYPELEIAMDFCNQNPYLSLTVYNKLDNILWTRLLRISSYLGHGVGYIKRKVEELTPRQREVLEIYLKRHEATAHKMCMPPVCPIER